MKQNITEFEKEILWKQGTRYCKLKEMQGKNGKYYMKQFDNFVFTAQVVENQYGNYIDITHFPIKYTKKQPQQSPGNINFDPNDTNEPWG